MDYYVETKEKVMSKEEKLKKIEELKRNAQENILSIVVSLILFKFIKTPFIFSEY